SNPTFLTEFCPKAAYIPKDLLKPLHCREISVSWTDTVISFAGNRNLGVKPVSRQIIMRPTLFYLILCLIVVRPIQGSRLSRLEDDVKSLKSFIFRELSSIRDEVKEISNRVDILENTTVTHDLSSSSKEMDITSNNLGDRTGESGKQLERARNNEGSHAVIAEVQNMRKAYANDKKNLHQLKQDVKGKL
ncbi:hypothetical protein MAR_002974, partial [Mya arenaria]